MFSAAFVVISIIAIELGMGYVGYLDIGVPIIISLIYLRCGLKYTILSEITSLLIIILTLGDISSAIFISQSMILGLICGILILKDKTIFDDLFYGSILACIVMIIIDLNFSTLTGYSFIKESQGYLVYIPNLNDSIKEVIYYLLIGSLPLGTMFVTYFFSILLGNKLGLLNDSGDKKFFIIKKFKSCGLYLSCSKRTINIGTLCIIILSILGNVEFIISHMYINIIINSIKYIMLFFIIQDCYNIINRFIYEFTKSRIILFICQFECIHLLIKYFKVTIFAMITLNFIIENLLNIRKKQIKILNDYLNYLINQNKNLKLIYK